MKSLKNKTAFSSKLKTMDKSVYKERRKIIDIIYSLKNEGIKLPRIEVRIVTSKNNSICGYAYMNKNIIHIVDAYLESDFLYQVVLHEILHATKGIEHNENCDLMASHVRNISSKKALSIFKTYLKD